MRLTIFTIFFLFLFCSAQGQDSDTKWYSETTNNGITIQNSFPKGGLYSGPIEKHFNYSYLVFFHRVTNKTKNPFEIDINFSGDSIAIPNSPDTFMKLFLPKDTMTPEKESLMSYGITELESLDSSTNFHKILNPDEDCLFYTVAIFYQTKTGETNQNRGGNRAEFVLEDQNLIYKIPPQNNSLLCGTITIAE